jgi:hypothetical protein
MKKAVLSFACFIFFTALQAQDSVTPDLQLPAPEAPEITVNVNVAPIPVPPPKFTPWHYWKHNGFIQVNFNQISLSNWSGGGENTISVISLLDYSWRYNNGDSTTSWDNTYSFGYGLSRLSESGVRKSEDRIEIDSKLNRRASGNLNYSALLNFRSQFAPGYKYPNDSVVVSRFMAPGYLVLSLGMNYQPQKYLSIFLSPATGKGTFVRDQRLADMGLYGVEAALKDAEGNIIRRGRQFRPEFGAYVDVKFNKDVVKNVRVRSQLSLFANYTDRNPQNRKNIDVNWTTTINMKVNDYIGASLFTQLVYDHDVLIPVTRIVEGKKVQEKIGPRLQVKQMLGVGFAYKFSKKSA